MTNNKILWGILLLGWVVGSIYWHVCRIKQLCDTSLSSHTVYADTQTPTTFTPLVIADPAGLNLRSTGDFGFAKSGAEADLSAVKAEIDSLALFTAAHPGKIITITGSYVSGETNTTTFSNLGMARAAAIKTYLTSKGLADSLFLLKARLNDEIVFSADSMSGGIDFTFTKSKNTAVVSYTCPGFSCK